MILSLQVPDSPQFALNSSTALKVCECLGLSLHPGEGVGPSYVMIVLGIELDSLAQVACLRDDTLLALQDMVQSWMP